MEILVGILVGLAIGAGVATVVLAFRARKAASGVDGELADTVMALQRSVKLLQGRLNTLAPPRLGTGENVDPGDSQGPLLREHLTRAGVLRRYRELEALKGAAGRGGGK